MYESVEIRMTDKLVLAITKSNGENGHTNSVELLENGIKLIASKQLTDEQAIKIADMLCD